ncbi:hypothetical protein GGQ85_000353 [Nitrobacter vulgaris]|nr:hypothetical protein [Nitrobacter vulgaris]
MKTALKMLSAAAFAVIIATPALACNGRGNCENAPGQNKPGRVHGAPGPIAGAAGLPILAVGYGVYWLVRRRRVARDGARENSLV